MTITNTTTTTDLDARTGVRLMGQFKAQVCRYHHGEEVAKALLIAVGLGENVILHGKGGYGKSEMVLGLLRQIEEPFWLDAHAALSPDDLFGGVDLQALNVEHKIVLNIQGSLFAHRLSVIDEALDMPPGSMAALKGALESRVVRNGDQRVESQLRTLVAMTNKRFAEWVGDDPAISALLQRFGIQLEVEWPSHAASDYLEGGRM